MGGRIVRFEWLGVRMVACALLAPGVPRVPQGEGHLNRLKFAPDPRIALVLEGFVLAEDGNPAEGVRVASSSGGAAVTDVAGSYRFAVEVPLDAASVQVTARGSRGGAAWTRVMLRGTGTMRVDPLLLALGASCSPSWLPTFGGAAGTNGGV